jgi:hypothetical protein
MEGRRGKYWSLIVFIVLLNNCVRSENTQFSDFLDSVKWYSISSYNSKKKTDPQGDPISGLKGQK